MNIVRSSLVSIFVTACLICTVSVLQAQDQQNNGQEAEQTSANEDGNFYIGDGSGRLRFESADGHFKARIGGRVMVDFTFTSVDDEVSDPIETATNDSSAVDSGADIRRAWLFTQGTMYDSIRYKLQYDFSGEAFRDVYLQFPGLIPNGNVTVGRFKEPFSLEELTSSKYITLTERALPNAFAPGWRTGAQAAGTLFEEQVSYGVALTRAESDRLGASRGEGGYAGTARLTGTPYSNDDDSRLLHVGGSVSNRSVDGTGFSAAPEVSVVEDHISVSAPDAEGTTLWNVDTAFVYKSFSVQGEYMRADIDSTSLNDPSFNGWYVMASYWLTGEQRPYNRGGGSFGRVRPRNPFGVDGGSGAWEIAARASSLDLNDGPAQGGELDTYTAGVNWHLNPFTRVMANYVHGDVSQGIGGADGSGDYVTFRFQVDF